MERIVFLIEEAGFERHDGEFHQIYCVADDIETAKKRYEEFKQRLFNEKDFFLKEELDNGDWEEHEAISSNGNKLPVLSIETEWERYELYVAECGMVEPDKDGKA